MKNSRVFLFLYVWVTLASCSNQVDYYHINYSENEIVVNNSKGRISFPVNGEVRIVGKNLNGELMPGGVLTMQNSNEDKEQTIVFEHSLQDSSIQISTTTYYKKDCVIEYDGIIGKCKGDIGFERDKNVFVCGTPVLVGFTDKTKEYFAICPEYGALTTYYSKL